MEPSFMRSRQDETNYLFWLVTIIIGVTIGNLLSTLITTKVLAYQAEQALREVSKVVQRESQAAQVAMREAAAQNAAQMASHQEAVRQQRAQDPTGLKLSQSCLEWRNADAKLNSYTTRAESEKHCNRYDRYVQSGWVDLTK